ncbi:hypothetical protein [Endozoicomonas sp. ONNA2]|uniref:hypothetical protein n=1 Tax=Endozoicomonas sp. ONNA2 TaxID=2828741 RepID=UPI002148BB8E|nr:hypothetical protein [Endozoicomonas sp. ONNA2]
MENKSIGLIGCFSFFLKSLKKMLKSAADEKLAIFLHDTKLFKKSPRSTERYVVWQTVCD